MNVKMEEKVANGSSVYGMCTSERLFESGLVLLNNAQRFNFFTGL